MHSSIFISRKSNQSMNNCQPHIWWWSINKFNKAYSVWIWMECTCQCYEWFVCWDNEIDWLNMNMNMNMNMKPIEMHTNQCSHHKIQGTRLWRLKRHSSNVWRDRKVRQQQVVCYQGDSKVISKTVRALSSGKSQQLWEWTNWRLRLNEFESIVSFGIINVRSLGLDHSISWTVSESKTVSATVLSNDWPSQQIWTVRFSQLKAASLNLYATVQRTMRY
jgi:hypothetical protein